MKSYTTLDRIRRGEHFILERSNQGATRKLSRKMATTPTKLYLEALAVFFLSIVK